VIRISLYLLFFLSGAAALGYQLVWAKMLSTGLGHEMPAVLAIIAAFMSGMALGAAFIDRFVPRSARAGLWLCGLELTIGVWAVLASFLIPHANDLALSLIGLAPSAVKHWLIAFTLPVLVLLPATTAMGATLPAMEKFLSVSAPQNQSIGSVYAANTFGAVAGTLLAPFVLMPALGLSRSCWGLAVVNIVVGAGAFGLARTLRSISLSPQRGEGRGEGRECNEAVASASALRLTTPHPQSLSPLSGEGSLKGASISAKRITVTLFFTGLLSIGFETAGVRVLSQVLEGTVFTYAAVLAVFLLGTAAGAAGYHRWWRNREPLTMLVHLLGFTSAACLLAIAFMARTPVLYRWARNLGDSPTAVLGAELITSLAVFALPTFCMGAVFSHLAQLARAKHGRIGDVVAWNTLGAALAPVLAVLLLPVLGCHVTLCVLGIGYILLTSKLPRPWLGTVIALALGVAISANLRIVDVPPGGRIADFREGVMASVAVLADTNDQRTLRVDNRFQMGGTAAADAEYRQAHLPLLLHPAPRRALFLGVGTGISFGAASLYPNLQADGVELVPEVVEVMTFFESRNFSAIQQPNLTLHVADARRFVRATDEHYDVIVADLFHPYRDGAGALYTREHFAAIRERLATNGMFCQWLPLHQLDEPTLRVIVQTFLNEFPDTEAWLLRFNVDVPAVALIGRRGASSRQTNIVELRLGEVRLAGELKRLALADSLRLYGHWLAGSEDLRAFASRAPLNKDDDPRVTFMAPRQSYQRQSKPYASLQALLAVSDKSVADARQLPDLDRRGEFVSRLSRYLGARNVYLRGLIHDAENQRDEAIDAYIDSARRSSEFTSGYAQCLTIASVVVNSDPARAKKILERLIEAQPERPVAAELMKRLSIE